MVIIFLALAVVIFGVLSLLTCCVTCLCHHFKHRQPTCAARYTFEVDANENDDRNYFLQDHVGSLLNEANLINIADKDDVVVIQMHTMGSDTNV